MGTENFKLGDLYMRDNETGEMIKLEELKDIQLETFCPECELESAVPEGISIYISGTEIDRVDSVEIRFKEEK